MSTMQDETLACTSLLQNKTLTSKKGVESQRILDPY